MGEWRCEQGQVWKIETLSLVSKNTFPVETDSIRLYLEKHYRVDSRWGPSVNQSVNTAVCNLFSLYSDLQHVSEDEKMNRVNTLDRQFHDVSVFSVCENTGVLRAQCCCDAFLFHQGQTGCKDSIITAFHTLVITEHKHAGLTRHGHILIIQTANKDQSQKALAKQP